MNNTTDVGVAEWELNEWMRLPGSNSDALLPLGTGVIKTMPPLTVKVFDTALPILENDVRDKNNTYLELTSGLSDSKWILIAGSIIAGPLPLGAPIFSIWLLFLGPSSIFSNEMKIILLLMSLIPFAIALPMYSVLLFSAQDEPIRFCRRDRKVYRYHTPRRCWLGMDLLTSPRPEIKEYDWTQCRAEVVRKIVATKSSARLDCFLEIAVLDSDSNKVTDRFRVGDRDVYSNFSSRIVLWETIRRYMQDGPEKVPSIPIKIQQGKLFYCLDKFNPLRIPADSEPGAQRSFGYMFAAMMWVISPFLLFSACCMWIGFRISRRIDWGNLEATVFQLNESDIELRRTSQVDTDISARRNKDEGVMRYRVWFWLISIAVQIFAIVWILIIKNQY